jgi:hypothetical protein
MKEALGSSDTSVLTGGTNGVISQKTPFFIVTAAKTSNLTTNVQFANVVFQFFIEEEGQSRDLQ